MSIAEKIDSFEHEYFRLDLPIPFCGLKIYPIKVKDYELYAACSTCLTLNKNETAQGIKSSYMEFLISKIVQKNNEGREWSFKFQKLLELVFHIKNGLKCSKCGKVISYSDEYFLDFLNKINEITKSNNIGNIEFPVLACPDCGGKELIEMIKIERDESNKPYFLVDGHKIQKKDFDLLRYTVLFQNDPDYRDESWIDPLLKKDYEEKRRLERQKNDVYASMEQKVIGLSITTSYKFDEIWDMSIRRFTMALAAVDDLINYKIMRTAICSGFVSLPEGQKIDHWLYKPIRDMYGESYKSLDQATAEVGQL